MFYAGSMKINKSLQKKKIISIVVVAILLVLGVGTYAIFRMQKTTSSSSNTVTTKTYNPTTITPTTNVPAPDTSKGSGGATQSPTSGSTVPTPSSTVKPSTPIGTFVSNHHVSVGSQDAEQSTCTTTPGADCSITLTSGSTVKTLTAAAADSNGNVTWTWTPAGMGLTAGSWVVQATSRIGTNTAVANDAMNLEVAQ